MLKNAGPFGTCWLCARRKGEPNARNGSKPARLAVFRDDAQCAPSFSPNRSWGPIIAGWPHSRMAVWPSRPIADSLLMQRYAWSRGWRRLWRREFFLQLLDDGGIAGGSPFLALLSKFFFQFLAFFYVALPELGALGFCEM